MKMDLLVKSNAFRSKVKDKREKRSKKPVKILRNSRKHLLDFD